ncbi:hypothetical protein A2881_05020 [Candidatus Peribacteria bacterium RIFCSPHIGHO2_01_FULL_55_13]|nr:MAG: hypothetical protein A2881_05020 [Candidatus Peribacteria bacterium RIFCSPHIGHO2_01_FULL_55_13]OGJ64251.1 MAG: hypothetical protein A3F36_02475 [Candidatus Peribacteria bacterium RIFCSPHIGHO2_12_FULL_55_11]
MQALPKHEQALLVPLIAEVIEENLETRDTINAIRGLDGDALQQILSGEQVTMKIEPTEIHDDPWANVIVSIDNKTLNVSIPANDLRQALVSTK